MATSVSSIMKLLFLESKKPGQTINIYLNAKGGDEIDILSIIDCMQFISSPCEVYAIGSVEGSASLILAAGAKRYCLPNAQISLSQPVQQISGGQCANILIQTEQAQKIKDRINKLFSKFTGQKLELLVEKIEREVYFTAEEAKEFGLIDCITVPKKKK